MASQKKKGSLLTRLTRLAVIPTLVIGIAVTALAIIATNVSYNTVYEDEATSLATAYSTAIKDCVNDPAAVTDIIKDVKFGENGICFVIDKNGVVIASSSEVIPVSVQLSDNNAFAAGTKGMDTLAAKMLAAETDVLHIFPGGENYYTGFCPISGSDGLSIAVSMPWRPIIWKINFSALQILAIAAIAVVIVIIVVRFPVKRIAAPISNAAKRLVNFANGDISTPAPAVSGMGGEIEEMENALGSMISTIGSCIDDIRSVLTAMADGDLNAMPDADYRGELAEIKDSLTMISTSLSQTMNEVSRSAIEVRDGASQLADGSSQLSQNAVTQASAVDEITSTVVDIAQKTEANNEKVREALETVRTANTQANEGSHSMDEMLEAIHEIETSSNEIAQIMKVIDDIAFQTNILALNAAIEAARAGDAGKGFAVVADEVRNLAGKSAEAAKQTGDLITRSIEAVNRGTELADATSGALEQIVAGVGEIAEKMAEIAEANNEQAIAVEQISSGMENVNIAIHNTSATAEQSAAASEELSALAVTLTDAVSQFTTKE